MDGSDAFGAGVQAPQDDPFEQAEREFEQEDPFDDSSEVTKEPVAGVPVVDAEGNPVEGEAAPAASDPGTSEPAEPAAVASQDANGDVDPTSHTTSAESGGSGDGEPDPTDLPVAPTDGDQVVPSAAATEELPEDMRDKNNKVTHRKYLIFRQASQEKWEQLAWYEDGEGRLVPKGTEGATRRNCCLVRSRDDALAIGYAAVGAPLEGMELVAVTAGVFAPRMVKPAPIQPIRSRLTIS